MILSIYFSFLEFPGKSFEFSFRAPRYAIRFFFQLCFLNFFIFFFLGMRLQAPSYSQNTSCDRKPYFGHYGTNAMNSALHHAPYYTEKCVMWLRWSNEEFAQKKKSRLIALESGNIWFKPKELILVWCGCKLDCAC